MREEGQRQGRHPRPVSGFPLASPPMFLIRNAKIVTVLLGFALGLLMLWGLAVAASAPPVI